MDKWDVLGSLLCGVVVLGGSLMAFVLGMGWLSDHVGAWFPLVIAVPCLLIGGLIVGVPVWHKKIRPWFRGRNLTNDEA